MSRPLRVGPGRIFPACAVHGSACLTIGAGHPRWPDPLAALVMRSLARDAVLTPSELRALR